MRLTSFLRDGLPTWGVVTDDGDHLFDLGGVSRWPTLRRALAAPEAIDWARGYVETHEPDAAVGEVRFLPVVPDPDKILCVGLNYEAHRLETGRPESRHPTLFVRFASSQVGHGEPMVVPRESEKLDYEGELAVVIGRAGRRIPPERALAHVAGYACYHDGSVRDWQRHSSQFTPGKNFPATGGFGPWLVTTDVLPDPSRSEVVTRVDGEELQRSATDRMIFPVPALIAYASTFTELVPGDVIATGTPGGVGFKREPPRWLRPGEVAEVEVAGVGVLRNPIVAEPG